MKTYIISLFLFLSNTLFSQYIEGLSVTQNGTNQIKVHLKVYLPASGESLSYTQDIVQNTITINACYYMIGTGAVTEFEKDFFIDIPYTKNYILNTNLYISWDETTCDYHSLEDTATLNFSTPVVGTISLSTIDSQTKNREIVLFPNPAKDFLNINTAEKIEYVNIYDSSGKLLHKKIENAYKININDLKNGVYYIEIFTDKKRWYKKFIVQK